MTFSLSTNFLSDFLVFPTWVLLCLSIKLHVPSLNWGWSRFWAPAAPPSCVARGEPAERPPSLGPRPTRRERLCVETWPEAAGLDQGCLRGGGALIPSPAVGCRRICAGRHFPSRGRAPWEPLGLCRGPSLALPAALSTQGWPGEGLRTGAVAGTSLEEGHVLWPVSPDGLDPEGPWAGGVGQAQGEAPEWARVLHSRGGRIPVFLPQWVSGLGWGLRIRTANSAASRVVLPLRVRGPHVRAARFPEELCLRDWLGVGWGSVRGAVGNGALFWG